MPPHSCTRKRRQQAARPRDTDEFFETLRLSLRDTSPTRHQAVVAAPFVIVVVALDFSDPAVILQLLDETIQRSGPKLHGAARLRFYFLDNPVTVPLTACERKQNMKRRRAERQGVPGIERSPTHGDTT